MSIKNVIKAAQYDCNQKCRLLWPDKVVVPCAEGTFSLFPLDKVPNMADVGVSLKEINGEMYGYYVVDCM